MSAYCCSCDSCSALRMTPAQLLSGERWAEFCCCCPFVGPGRQKVYIRHGVTGSYLGVRLRRHDRSEKGDRRWTGFRDLSDFVYPSGRACGPSIFSPRSKCLFYILQYNITPPPPRVSVKSLWDRRLCTTDTLCTCTASKTFFDRHTPKYPPPPTCHLIIAVKMAHALAMNPRSLFFLGYSTVSNCSSCKVICGWL